MAPSIEGSAERVEVSSPVVKSGSSNLPEPPVTWAEIHQRPASYDGQAERELKWLRSLARRLPSGACGCDGHWLKYLVDHPPALSDSGAYWRWTVEARAAVARRVGKPAFTVAQAADAQGIDPRTGRPRLDRLTVARSRSLLGGKLDRLLSILASAPCGDVAELGVYRGGATAAMALRFPDRTIHAFDTFTGMPAQVTSETDVHRAGDFADSAGVLQYLSQFPNVRVHRGIFPDTTAGLDDARFGLVHLDADQYQSTLDSLRWFWPRLVTGGSLVLDDWDWPKCPGVRRAVTEYFGYVPVKSTVIGNQLIIRKQADDGLHIHNSATGLGDAISGLYAACGLANATQREVVYHAHSALWLKPATHPLVRVEPIEDGALGIDANGGWSGYRRQILGAMTRTQSYCDNLASQLQIKPFRPARPEAVDRPNRDSAASVRRIVLAPFSAYTSREWPRAKWTKLAAALHGAGFTVIAIGSSKQQGDLEQTFRNVNAQWFFGQSAEVVTSLIGGAAALVANDSGPAHLGGLLGIPTVCVHAGSLPHEFLFDLAPSVVSVTAVRRVPRADHDVDALSEVTTGQVLDKTLEIAGCATVRAAG